MPVLQLLLLSVLLPSLLQATEISEHIHIEVSRCNATIPDMENLFHKICAEQKTANNRARFSDCRKITKDFLAAFSYKDPKQVTRDAYKQYFTTVPLKAEDNQNLFWSGTFGIATIISKNNIRGVTVSSSPNADSSIILNKIGDQIKKIPFWCGSPTASNGIDQETEHCDCTPSDNFWAEFSARFAKVAKGTAFYLCSGERKDGKGAYSESSFFGSIEIPAMNTALATRLVDQVVVLVVSRGHRYGETCGHPKSDSLTLLKATLERKRIKYRCYDVVGDPNSKASESFLANHAANIIRTWQKAGNSGSVVGDDFYNRNANGR